MSKFYRTTISYTIATKDKPFGNIDMPKNLLDACNNENMKVLTSPLYVEEICSLDGGLEP